MTSSRDPAAAATIAVEGLTKRYGEVTAVDDLSFRVRPGAVTGFLGPNGAGKTTALKAIVGVARPTAGRALINGAPINSMVDRSTSRPAIPSWCDSERLCSVLTRSSALLAIDALRLLRVSVHPNPRPAR